MATQTPILGLTKPAVGEFYDVGVPNGNMDKIEAAILNVDIVGTVKQGVTNPFGAKGLLCNGASYDTPQFPDLSTAQGGVLKYNAPTQDAVTGYHLFIYYKNGYYVYGHRDASGYPCIWYSTTLNGTYTKKSLSVTIQSRDKTTIEYANGVWVICVRFNTGGFRCFSGATLEGAFFESCVSSVGSTNDWGEPIWTGTQWAFTHRINGYIYLDYVTGNPTNANWTERVVYQSDSYTYGVAVGAGKLVFVYSMGTTNVVKWISTADLAGTITTGVTVSTGLSEQVVGLGYVNSKWVAAFTVSGNGIIYHSTDLATWTKVTIAGANLTGCNATPKYINGNYILVTAGAVLFSPTLSAWTTVLLIGSFSTNYYVGPMQFDGVTYFYGIAYSSRAYLVSATLLGGSYKVLPTIAAVSGVNSYIKAAL